MSLSWSTRSAAWSALRADYEENWSMTDKPRGVSRWKRANEAPEEALLELGALTSNPPVRPERQSGWRPFSRIKTS
jgi:hypothetical protein